METVYCKPKKKLPTFCRKIGVSLDRRCGEVVSCFRKKGVLLVLIAAKRLKDLCFSDLMSLYEEDNQIRGRRNWPDEPEFRQLALAEADAYGELQEFFRQPGAVQYIWQENGRYVAALRLESHRDGLLLTGLTTAPADRSRGYATALLSAVLERRDGPVYSHIDNTNRASIRVHEKCGFVRMLDTAILLDGSASSRMGTYLYRKE